jgi:hypothetical protein
LQLFIDNTAKNTYSIMSNNPSSEHTGEQIKEDVSYPKLNSTEITPEFTSYQPDNYDLTWGRLPNDLFRSVASHLNLNRDICRSMAFHLNLKRCDIMPLLCVCKKMTIKVLRELLHVTGYHPDLNSCKKSCFSIKLKSTRFYLHPLWISYTSSLWRIFKDPCPIHRLIINLKYKVVSSEPLSILWDLSSLDTLMINMSKRFDQDEQVSVYDGESETDNLPPLENFFDQYQLLSLKQMVLLNMYITPKTWDHLSPNLEFIQLVNCQLELPWNINLRKLKYLEEFTILLKSMGDASSESCLDLTKCTMEFPGMSRPLKFKDDPMLKVL